MAVADSNLGALIRAALLLFFPDGEEKENCH